MSTGDNRIKEEIEAAAGGIESQMVDAVCPELLIPNKETIAAMQELESLEGQHFLSVAELIADLADDHETR